MTTVGLWPHKALGQKSRHLIIQDKLFVIILVAITLSLGALYIRHNMKQISFFELGNTYITVFMNIVGLQRITHPFMKRYNETSKDFFTKFHLLHHKNRSDYAHKIHVRVHKLCSFFTFYIHYQMIIGYVLFNMMPVYNNFHAGMYSANKPVNGTYEHSVYYHLPFDYITTFNKYYLGVFTFNWFLSYMASCTFCYGDLYVCIMVFHIWGHFKILEYHLENFPRPKNDNTDSVHKPSWYTDEETEAVTQMLITNIEHHKMIKNFTTKMLDTFGYMLCTYMAFHQASGCILLLECSKLDPVALARYGPLTIILFQQLVQISIVFELIGDKNETIKESVYEVPWECMNDKNRKILLIFLCNVQSKIELTALGMVTVGVQTMAQILKTSVSYFIFLRAFTTEV